MHEDIEDIQGVFGAKEVLANIDSAHHETGGREGESGDLREGDGDELEFKLRLDGIRCPDNLLSTSRFPEALLSNLILALGDRDGFLRDGNVGCVG